MLVGTVGLFTALHTAATVAGAELAEGRGLTLAILVALVADQASLVATVGVLGAGIVRRAGLEAAVGEGIARKAVLAVQRRHARDAAVASWLAAWQPVNQAVVIDSALDAMLVDAMRTGRAGAERAASSRTTRHATGGASASGNRAPCLAAATPAGVMGRSGGRRAAERRARCSARGAGSASARFHVELEAPIAGWLRETEPSRGERVAKPTLAARLAPPSHGSTTSFFASAAANPRG